MKRPTLDASDRRIVGVAFVLVLAFWAVCIAFGAGLGAGVLAFRVMSGVAW